LLILKILADHYSPSSPHATPVISSLILPQVRYIHDLILLLGIGLCGVSGTGGALLGCLGSCSGVSSSGTSGSTLLSLLSVTGGSTLLSLLCASSSGTGVGVTG
jgi:hypothetical protein